MDYSLQAILVVAFGGLGVAAGSGGGFGAQTGVVLAQGINLRSTEPRTGPGADKIGSARRLRPGHT